MPELPEVEIVKIGLLKQLPKTPILDLKLFRQDLRFPLPIKQLQELKHQTLNTIERRGKFLIFKTNKYNFISHLGMTGHWRYETEYTPIKHDHILIHWANVNLVYNDPRRFGYMLLSDEDTFKNYGPDPIHDYLDPQAFFELGQKSKTPIKSWLLNQNNILGIGNIYASEILFRAKINPKKITAKLKLNHWQDIISQTKKTLNEAISKGGSSMRDYKNVEGQQGDMQNHWLVYGQEHQKCKVCAQKIKKIIQTNRSTYLCPRCQK